MRVCLLYPDHDVVWNQPADAESQTLVQDLQLEPIFLGMGGGDELARQVAASVLLSHRATDLNVISYRQAALQDCIAHPALVRELYQCAEDGLKAVRELGILRTFTRSPSSLLYSALRVLDVLVEVLGRLRAIAERGSNVIESVAFRSLFDVILSDLDVTFFEGVKQLRRELEFGSGLWASAKLGSANKASHYTLRRPQQQRRTLFERFFHSEHELSFTVAPRDESGHNALADIRNHALSTVAVTISQSNDHILEFLQGLRSELAFYLGAVRLHEILRAQGRPVCFPLPLPQNRRSRAFRGLYDVSLALTSNGPVVGNDLDMGERFIALVTGANRGGKTIFLRAFGQAQLLMQAGMFVPAESFSANVCEGIFTHFRRSEDGTMKSGKLGEELARLSSIVDKLKPDSLLLMNESFSSTNELEAAQIAEHVLSLLAEARVNVVFVTHTYAFAKSWYDMSRSDTIFLRAERLEDGTRTFRILVGEPFQTSFAEDIYGRVFLDARHPAEEQVSTAIARVPTEDKEIS
jgi:hypothetical protein